MTNTKIALVTGGSRGLGRDMAINIAKKGIDVVFTYHSNEKAAMEVEAAIEALGRKAAAFQLDTSDVSSFDAFFTKVSAYLSENYGKPNFDYIVNNAGTGIYKPFVDTTEADFDEMMNIHLKGVYFLTQKAVALMNDGGGIINISSGLARFTFPNSSAYAAMKGAIDVFTRYLAKELGGRGIRANVVAPGAIATEFGGGENKTNEQKRKVVASVTALGRVGEPEDIGGIVAFLCTEDARWVNGQRIEASGGTML
ncbi:NAD(P)-dependent dehydrogenase (short-subunit alcohol dehydrogenase family) [Roseivirga pacifica]|uniref:NAD(P)-dependent dehydrogenase, short-chain alcohol dehydrogenase family n=1 Tax=Roseivirga pacifica TaxID=1267423 RepID=A0A1I0R0R2_9BACT|nr:SDR family oxidoreductase [Roseivirga pacifica]RKQ42231.1 NAD(P)-dependent dehydrogenase (short-subunit alcohol dehydrogenase family) [Roseivirga pacifica]SEW33642.1 NAD(P)-dependent dehydrogenase, short-chain alcohol dehydrogenase family [Roseivirga pacifica]